MFEILGLLVLAAFASAVARRDAMDGRAAAGFAIAGGVATLLSLIARLVDPSFPGSLDTPLALLIALGSVVLGGWSAPHLLVALIATLSRPPGRRWDAGGHSLVSHTAQSDRR